MRLEQFDFDLPKDRIANRPAVPRDSARMLIVDEGLLDSYVARLPELFGAGDILVVNDTQVVPARLDGFRGSAKVQITLDAPVSGSEWRALAFPARKLRPGDDVTFPDGLGAKVISRGLRGEVLLDFQSPSSEIYAYLDVHGILPLPPYISRADGPDARDLSDYQTIYAKHVGAVAAPTAGLHFSSDLFERLHQKGIRVAKITLHVGIGTFRPVTTDNVLEHTMSEERGVVSAEVAEVINETKKNGGRVVAVGSTVLRLLESASAKQGRKHAFKGATSIFMTPGYKFTTADFLMTNFHLPKSTLFMLVAAFSGLERMKLAYAHAIKNGYRFYSFGDASLLKRTTQK